LVLLKISLSARAIGIAEAKERSKVGKQEQVYFIFAWAALMTG